MKASSTSFSATPRHQLISERLAWTANQLVWLKDSITPLQFVGILLPTRSPCSFQAVVNSTVWGVEFLDHVLLHQGPQDLCHLQRTVLNLLFQEPPFYNPFNRIVRIRMGRKICTDLPLNFCFIIQLLQHLYARNGML